MVDFDESSFCSVLDDGRGAIKKKKKVCCDSHRLSSCRLSSSIRSVVGPRLNWQRK